MKQAISRTTARMPEITIQTVVGIGGDAVVVVVGTVDVFVTVVVVIVVVVLGAVVLMMIVVLSVSTITLSIGQWSGFVLS